MKRSFIYQDDKSHKFWNIEVSGSELSVNFGKAGTAGQTQTKSYTSDDECQKAADKLVAEKTKKGYSEVAAAPASQSATDNTVSKSAVVTPSADATAFPSTYLYNDLLALAANLKENPNGGEIEIVKVSKKNVQEMETAAGFPMPKDFADFCIKNGSLFYSKDDFIVATYCYNKEGVNGNNLYGFLSFYQMYKRSSFSIIEDEQKFLQPCWWVLGMILHGEKQWLFVTNPLHEVKIIYFAKDLRELSEAEYNEALLPVLNDRESLRDFMSTPVYHAAVENIEKMAVLKDNSTEEEDEKGEAERKQREESETQSFLDKYNIQHLSYDEVLGKLNVEELFDYWDGEEHYGIGEDYETERDYFEDSTIYFCDGDLTLDGDLKIPHVYFSLFVVKGNLTVNGKIANQFNDAAQYYVSGNTTVDYLSLGAFQKTVGTETVRYVASAWGQDDEVVHQMPSRHINAPYFFSWFYDLHCFSFEPHTVITALYNYDELAAYNTDNTILIWHDYAYVFRPDLYYTVEESHHDGMSLSTHDFYDRLKEGIEPFLEGVTADGIRLVREGLQLKQEGDTSGAYQAFREAMIKSPGYYPAYHHAGKCLFDAKAYAQAKEVFAKAIPLTPEKVLYEYASLEQGALCAILTGDNDTAETWARAAVEKNASASFGLRVLGEALIRQQALDEAEKYLKQSLAIKTIFSANWLLGLVYHLQGDAKKADTYYKASVKNNAKAKPYSKHTDLHYIYGDNVTVDWDKNPPARKVKDQAYWDQFFADILAQYGPDMYKKTGVWPWEWLAGKVHAIPERHRSQSMLLALLEHQTHGEYDVVGEIVRSFNTNLYTTDIILKAITRPSPLAYHYIPKEFLTEQILETHPSGLNLEYASNDLLTYDRCFRAVTQSQYNYKYVPEAFQDERMTIALIAGGNLQSSHHKDLPARYYTNEYILQAVELDINVMHNIPAQLVDQEVYQYAVARYGTDPAWPFIVEQYDRDRWRYGDQSSVKMMGQKVRDFGINVFDHVNEEAIDRHSFAYYKKHLGHLPEFSTKAKDYGWKERSNTSDRYSVSKEFDYDTFSRVWACFWDEEFIIKAFTVNADSGEHLYNLPEKYRTQKVCEVAVSKSGYNFQYVPKALITQEMVEQACGLNYGSALEYVPLAMRSASACQTAVAKDEDNIKFVPIELRTAQLFVSVIIRKSALTNYIPHDQYAAVFEILYTKFKDRFAEDFLLTQWGLGLIMKRDYEDARKKLLAAEKDPEPYASNLHKAAYYTGWTYFLEGNTVKADEYWDKAQAILKDEDVDDEHQLKFSYEEFQLPPVPGAYDFSKEDFDKQMREATLLIQDKRFTPAIDVVAAAEKQLADAQCSEMRLWAYVWDYKRYVLFEAGLKEESYACCRNTINELSKITLWPYLEEFNPIRAALRAAHNNLAYLCYETATDLKDIREGLNHIKITMKTVSPIEEKETLNLFYETHALLLHKAATFDAAYQKDLDKVVAKIKKLKLREAGVLTDELLSKIEF